MTARTTARRCSVVAAGVLGTLALAGPALAASTPGVPVPVPSPVAGAAAAVTGAAPADGSVTDPLTSPLVDAVATATAAVAPVVATAPAPVQQPVQQTLQQVTSAVAGPGETSQNPPTPTGGPGTVTPPSSSGSTGATGSTGGQQGTQGTTPVPAVAAAAAPADTASGTGVASMPDSFVRKLNALESASLPTGLASASNPMSLFGAPQVASTPSVPGLATPMVARPAGGQLESALPVGAPEAVPAALAATAMTVLAAAGAAHVLALRRRAVSL